MSIRAKRVLEERDDTHSHALIEFEFDTPAEAAAFAEGITYVNDGTIELVSVNGIFVVLEDEDGS